MGNEFLRLIDKFGPYNFTGLVSDNASNMKAAWKVVESSYPHISTYGCLAHGLNLLLQDILKIDEIAEIIDSAKQIIKAFRNSHILKAILAEKQGAQKISLKLPNATRWLSTESCLNSIIVNQQFLKEVAIDGRSKEFLDKDDKNLIFNDDF